MSLRTVPVRKCLDNKLVLFGFEVMDILAVFLVLSVLNFVFGNSPFKIFFVWLPSLVLAAILRFGKRGKPDNYLVHWLRFQMRPGIYSAFDAPTVMVPPPQLKEEVAS